MNWSSTMTAVAVGMIVGAVGIILVAGLIDALGGAVALIVVAALVSLGVYEVMLEAKRR